jgi:thiosulfate dehydrogenase
MTRHTARRAALIALTALAACRAEEAQDGTRDARPDSAARVAVDAGGGGGARFEPASWRAPADSELPPASDSLGASIRRGSALFLHTPDSLPGYAPGRISCNSCHLNGGRQEGAAPITGTHARYPRYLERTGAVVSMVERVNYCFTRSLGGSRLPASSREMQDFLAYIAWLSRGVPVGARLRTSDGLPPLPELAGDTGRGAAVYRARCATCHGADGGGSDAARVPALWGARSYAVGASMAREGKAASFIWHNMPLGQPKSLTQQEAFDVAAYVNSHARPDSPGKERDWPAGGAPKDVPYATQGHVAYRPPPLLPRANPAGAVVPRPGPARGRANE